MPGSCLFWERLVRSITKSPVAAVLASAKIDRAVFLRREWLGRKIGTFVGSIAEGLAFTLSTRAPVVGFAGFNCDNDG